MFGADLGAVHDGVTTVQLEGIVQLGETFLSLAITAVLNPTVGLHEYRRSQVLVGIPPVTRTRSAATSAENAFVHAIQFGAIFNGLQVLALAFLLGFLGLQPRLNAAVLLVEIAHIWDQILDHVHVGKRVNLGGLAFVFLVNVGEACKSVDSINVHGARTANSLTAGASKGEGRVLFVLNFQERV